jgi:uncharacterized protein YebE (UPF0316 family)
VDRKRGRTCGNANFMGGGREDCVPKLRTLTKKRKEKNSYQTSVALQEKKVLLTSDR